MSFDEEAPCSVCKKMVRKWSMMRSCTDYDYDPESPGLCGVECLATLPPGSFRGNERLMLPWWLKGLWRLEVRWGEAFRRAMEPLLDIPLVTGDPQSEATTIAPHSRQSATLTAPPPMVCDAATGEPLSADAVEALCEKARCGKGSETVLDTGVRRTLRVADVAAVSVRWAGLEAAVDRAAAGLRPAAHVGLRAELHDVLVYREGDFFLPHRDTTKAPGHVATLSVVVAPTAAGEVSGGELVVYGGEPRRITCRSEAMAAMGAKPPSSDDRATARDAADDALKTATWTGAHPGQWAAWLNSAYHEVTPVMRGRRIVAVYNLIVDDTKPVRPYAALAARRKQLQPQRASTVSSKRALFSTVPPDVLEHALLPFLMPQDLAAVAAASSSVRASLWSPTAAFAASLRSRAAVARGCARAVGAQFLLLACEHQYPLRRGGLGVDVDVLRGADAALAKACADVFGAVAVVAASVVAVIDEETYDFSKANAALVGPPIPKQTPKPPGPRVSVLFKSDVGSLRLSGEVDPARQCVVPTELEGSMGLPVRLFTNAIVVRQPSWPVNATPDAGRYGLYGNGPAIDAYRFTSCALCVPVDRAN